MPITNTQLNGVIAQAQQAIASNMYNTVLWEQKGKESTSLYWQSRYISAGIRVLTNYINGLTNLTNLQAEIISQNMLSCGKLINYSNVPLSFPQPFAIVVNPFPAYLATLADGPNVSLTTVPGYTVVVNNNGIGWRFAPVTSIGAQPTFVSGIIAHAGGGQLNAFLLSSNISRVDTVTTALDSVKLPTALIGAGIFGYEIINNTSNDMNVYPLLGDAFLGQAANAPIDVVGGQSLKVFCFNSGTWTIIN